MDQSEGHAIIRATTEDAMRFYEQLSPVDRRRVVLKAVAFSSAMEGMTTTRDNCLAELRSLEREQTDKVLTEQACPVGR